MDAALHANFRCAAFPSLGRSSGDLRVGQQVRRPSQLLRHAPLAECAEAALVCAPIGVIDVPATPVNQRAGENA